MPWALFLFFYFRKKPEKKTIKYVEKKVFSNIKEPDDEFGYCDKLATIAREEDFQWYHNTMRENVISQLSGDIPGVKSGMYLTNKDQIAGALKVLDMYLAGLEKAKEDTEAVKYAEERKNDAVHRN